MFPEIPDVSAAKHKTLHGMQGTRKTSASSASSALVLCRRGSLPMIHESNHRRVRAEHMSSIDTHEFATAMSNDGESEDYVGLR